jgi:hypothetical protein
MPGGKYADNPYRPGGMLIPKEAFVAELRPGENLVEIFV